MTPAIPRIVAGLVACGLMALALAQLLGETRGLSVTRTTLDGTPVTVFSTPGAAPAPAVVIAHGFAGSQQLMLPFATTLARAGYVAVTFDALGHGGHPGRLTGDVATEDGATSRLLSQLESVDAYARTLPQADGRLALLGHSMASDIVVRAAIADPSIDATIAVSLFSPQVTPDLPRNLLVITGALEPGLTDEALRVAGLAAGAPAEPFVTSGDFETGSARRAVLSPGVEHVGVLYSATSQREARDWLDLVFDRRDPAAAGADGAAAPDAATDTDDRAGWLGIWFLGVVGLAWSAAPLLPRLAPTPVREAAWARAFAAAAILPALATPFLARLAPEGVLPAPVADYLSVHFLIYGLLTAALLWRMGWRGLGPVAPLRLALAVAGFAVFALAAIYLPVDRFVTAFAPQPARITLFLTLFAGLLPYFLADEALTRAPTAPRGAYPLTKLAFLVSVGIAIALDPGRLFFLVLILPVMLIFFTLFGLFSGWTYRATGTPLTAALACAALFAWAIAVTFPILGA